MDDFISTSTNNTAYTSSGSEGYEAEQPKKLTFKPVDENTFAAESSYRSLNGGDSMLLELIKCIIGAVVGAVPGFVLWIIIGKVGFVAAACGLLLAGGIVMGYTFMSKDNTLPPVYGIVICIVVMLLSVYFAEKIVWTWELSEQFQIYINDARSEMYSYGDASGYSRVEIDNLINDELRKNYGFTEGTFSDCWNHFSKAIGYLDLKGRYFINLLESYAFAAIGGASLLAKFANKR